MYTMKRIYLEIELLPYLCSEYSIDQELLSFYPWDQSGS
jgi:hypothetical protein